MHNNVRIMRKQCGELERVVMRGARVSANNYLDLDPTAAVYQKG